MLKKRNFICEFHGCNREFSQSNHLKQHNNKQHFSNIDRYNDEVSNIFKLTQDYDKDVDWEHELDEEEEKIEEIVINYTIPPIILQNPELEGSIVDININIKNPDFFMVINLYQYFLIYKNKVSSD